MATATPHFDKEFLIEGMHFTTIPYLTNNNFDEWYMAIKAAEKKLHMVAEHRVNAKCDHFSNSSVRAFENFHLYDMITKTIVRHPAVMTRIKGGGVDVYQDCPLILLDNIKNAMVQ